MADTRLRLVVADRAADARVRIYGYELDALLQVADAMQLDRVPVSAVRQVVDRMLDRESQTAAAGTRRRDSRRPPQEGTQ